jgi:uncharacterized membrane protein YoaK (UPF0700 family)
VFCNAQTANVMLLAMVVGNGRWLNAAYLLLPISACLLGSLLSEWIGKSVKRLNLTTFVTNHMWQIGSNLSKRVRRPKDAMPHGH